MVTDIEGYRLSPQQRRLWRQQPSGSAYKVQAAFQVEGDLDKEALERAILFVVERHQILRTRFRRAVGVRMPVQVIGDPCMPPLPLLRLDGLAGGVREAALASLLEQELRRPVDLGQDPPLRVVLAVLEARRHALVLTLPALCADGPTLGHLVREIAAVYAAALAGGLPGGESLQYVQFAEWQNVTLEEGAVAESRHPWDCLNAADVAAAGLPFADRSGSAGLFVPRPLTLGLPAALALEAFAGAARLAVAIPALPLAIWQVLLSRLTGRVEIAVGIALDGRVYDELEGLPGPYETYLPVVCRLGGQTPFLALVQQVDRALAATVAAREAFFWETFYPGDGGSSIFLPFGYDFAPEFPALSVGGLSWTLWRRRTCSERFEVKLCCLARGRSLELELHYNASICRQWQGERLAAQLGILLEDGLSRPETPVGDLRLLGAAERAQVLVEWNAGRSATAARLVHRTFADRATAVPERTAIRYGSEWLTYGQLNDRSNRLAHHLLALGLPPEGVVAVCAEPSPDLVVALLGVLKAGGTYVPLDPVHPGARRRLVLEDVDAAFLLTREGFFEAGLLPSGLRVLSLETLDDILAMQSATDPESSATAESLAYILYTSGSTGRPKGVMVPHGALASYLDWCAEVYPEVAAGGAPLHSSLAFDLTVTSLFAPLLAGSLLTLVEVGGDLPLARALADGRGHGLVKATPTHLKALSHGWPAGEPLPAVGVLVVGGESLLAESLAFWRRSDTGARIVNEYGPTEATVGCCAYEVPPGEPGGGPVPIGRPLASAEVYILDERLEPVPPGVVGEICIGGPGLARGYLGYPELTAASFLPHPFSDLPGARLYRSGDLARHRPDGNLEFLGRLDEQVKIRGHRVEPGEIEAVLLRHPTVRDAAVVSRELVPGELQLVAYVAVGLATALPVDIEGFYRLPNGLGVVHLNRNETDQLYREIFEEQIYFRNGITLDDGDCVFDVGANIGLFTLYVLAFSPGTRVFAFEPIPALCTALRANVAGYGLRATVSAYGLAEAARTASFTYYPRMTTMSGMYADPAQDERVARAFLCNQDRALAPHAADLLAGRFEAEAVGCRLTTLSEAMREHGIERIDLLKLDVERSELAVLSGIEEPDWAKIRQIVIEVHGDDRLARVMALLNEQGFDTAVERPPALAGTGLCHVYARRRERTIRASLPTLPAIPNPEKLRAFVAGRLPEFMVPARFLVLPELPTTASGKLDRLALLAHGVTAAAGPRSVVPPRSPAELLLAEIWSQVLDISPVGATDNFFELGGDSILGLHVVARANQAGLRLQPRHLFQHQTLARLAAAAELEQAARAEPGSVSGWVPLTPVQLWFFAQNHPEPHHFNQAVLIKAEPPLDAVILAATVARLVACHDALRLRFAQLPSGWVQWPAQEERPVFTHLDLAALPAATRQPAIAAATADLQGSLDLARGPILRAAFFEVGSEESGRFLLLVHHLAIDAVSWLVLREDLAMASRSRAGDPAPRLPAGRTPFCVWARRLAEHARSQDVRRETPYWLRAGEPRAVPLPLDAPGAAGRSTEASAYTRRGVLAEAATTTLLGTVARACRARPVELVLAAVALALARWAGTDIVLLDFEGHGREDLFADLDTARTVGWFTSRFPLQLEVSASAGPAAVLQRIKEQFRAVPGRGLGYGLLRYAAGDEDIAAALRALPQAEVSFAYFGDAERGLSEALAPGAPIEMEMGSRSRRSRRPYLFEVDARVAAGRLELDWTCCIDLHRAATVEGLARDSIEVLRSFVREPVSEIDALDPSDFPLTALDQHELKRLVLGCGRIEDVYPLSSTQHGLLFHTLSSPFAGAYSVPLSCSLVGDLDVPALRQAWREVVARHPALRTVFAWEGLREPLQVVLEETELPWTEEDWRGLPSAERHSCLEAQVEAERTRGFDLGRVPLLRLSLVRTAATVHHLFWTFHHLLLDGWSVSLLLQEVLAFYEAQRRDIPCRLAPVPPYRDYIAYLRRLDLGLAESFWRRQLTSLAAVARLPGTAADPAAWGSRPAAVETHLSGAATHALEAFARRSRLTLNTLLQGAWALVLQARSEGSEVVFGTTIAGRPSDLAGSESMVGLFINTLPLVVSLPPEAPAADWLAELQIRNAQLREHQHSPLAEVQKWTGTPPGEAVFESVLVFENYPAGLPLAPAGRSIEICEVRCIDPSHYPLTVTAAVHPDVSLRLACDPCRFDPASAAELLADLEVALTALPAHPGATLRQLGEIAGEARRGRRLAARDELSEAARSRLRQAVRRPVDRAAGNRAPAGS